MSDKKSFFSRSSICDIINETVNIINESSEHKLGIENVAENLLLSEKINVAIYNDLTKSHKPLKKEKKSFFSKNAISEIIDEIVSFNSILTKEQIAICLIDRKKISEAIYYKLTNFQKNFGDCTAMIKKGDRRCGNPITKVNSKFCALHINNTPDMVWEDYEQILCKSKKI